MSLGHNILGTKIILREEVGSQLLATKMLLLEYLNDMKG